jgi:hypothetical protein
MNKTTEKDKSRWLENRENHIFMADLLQIQTNQKTNTQQQTKSIKRISTTPSTWNIEKISNSTSNKQQI